MENVKCKIIITQYINTQNKTENIKHKTANRNIKHKKNKSSKQNQ